LKKTFLEKKRVSSQGLFGVPFGFCDSMKRVSSVFGCLIWENTDQLKL